MAVATGRWRTILFYALAAGGAAVAFGLGVAEVYDKPPVDIGAERVRREGNVATVQVTVKNRSQGTLCPEIRIAARDREGLDLEEVVARPEGTGALAAGDADTYVGVFRGITPKEFREELDEFTAYAFAAGRCR